MRRHRGRACPGHDVVIVEGYRKSGLPTIEIMRAGNKADARTAEVFAEGARKGWALGTDFTQFGRGSMPHAAEVHPDDRSVAQPLDQAEEDRFARSYPDHADISNKMPTAATVAVVTDIPLAGRSPPACTASRRSISTMWQGWRIFCKRPSRARVCLWSSRPAARAAAWVAARPRSRSAADRSSAV